MFFPHVRNFTWIYGPFSCLIIVLFGLIFMDNFVILFKCSLNFRAYALKLKLNKAGYTNFAKFRLQNMSSKIERAFEKMTKYVFVFILPSPTFTSNFRQFHINFRKKNILYLKSSISLCDEYHFLHINNCHESGEKFYFSEKFNFP